MRFLFLAIALIATPALAVAQARNGNVYDGTSHEPSPDVTQAEKRAGVAPTPQQDRAETGDVEAIAKQLIAKTPKDPNAACVKTLARC